MLSDETDEELKTAFELASDELLASVACPEASELCEDWVSDWLEDELLAISVDDEVELEEDIDSLKTLDEDELADETEEELLLEIDDDDITNED